MPKPQNPRNAVELDRNRVWHHLTQHGLFEETDPLLIVEGVGMRVTDASGREYLDAVSGGVWTVNIGYGRDELAEVAARQITIVSFLSSRLRLR